MSIVIIHIKDQIISQWSGGTTTQLYIQPESSIFANKNFNFRISTAKIEVEDSEFTEFSGYIRKLKVLEGNFSIEHIGQYKKELALFDQDNFSGDWRTKGKGKVTDFNVIYKPGIDLILYHIEVEPKEKLTLLNTNLKFIYVFNGSGSIDNQKVVEQDFIEIKMEEEIHYEAETHSILIIVEVRNQ